MPSRRVPLLPGISEGVFRPSFNRIISDHDEDSDDSELEDDEEPGRVSGVSGHRAFHACVGVVIMANTVMISMECALIQHERYKALFCIGETLFTLVYVAEIAFRVKEQGLVTFFAGDDFMWNWFDFLVTIAGVIDSITAYLGVFFSSVKMHGSSSTRLFRVLRIMRFFRAFKFVADIDFVIATAAAATLKLAALVLLLLLVSAIITTNILWDAPDEHVKGLFGNLGQSMWTLFKLMTLEDWIPLVERVERINPEMRVFFILFIFFGSIALISLVPAIFVELQLLERNKIKEERLAEKRRLRRRSKKDLLRHLFQLSDKDDDGFVSIGDLQDALEDNVVMDELSGKFTLSMTMGDNPNRVSTFQRSLGMTEMGDIRDLKFGVFLFWADKLFEMTEIGEDSHVDEGEKFGEGEFIRGMLQIWGDVDMNVLWRNMTATRIFLMANGGCGGSKVARRFCGHALHIAQTLSMEPKRTKAAARVAAVDAFLNRGPTNHWGSEQEKRSSDLSVELSSDLGMVSCKQEFLNQGISNVSSKATKSSSADLSADIRLLAIKVGELHQQIGGLASEVSKETSALVDAGCIRLQKYFDDHFKQFARSGEDLNYVRKSDFAMLRETFSSGSAKVDMHSSRQEHSWLPPNLKFGSTTELAVSQSPKKVTKLRWKDPDVHEFQTSSSIDALDGYAHDTDQARQGGSR